MRFVVARDKKQSSLFKQRLPILVESHIALCVRVRAYSAVSLSAASFLDVKEAGLSSISQRTVWCFLFFSTLGVFVHPMGHGTSCIRR